jgi:hypothetical protein
MEAAGREFVVLRVADILDMREEDQRLGVEILVTAANLGVHPADPPAMTAKPYDCQQLRSFIQRAGVNGYIRVSRDQISSLSMDDLAIVQQWLSVYRDVRLGKGEPSRTDPCEHCGGRGKIAGGLDCINCGGEGKVTTFLEISDEEAALAEGGAP